MFIRSSSFLLAAVLVLSGCAGTPQSPVYMTKGNLSESKQHVGVAMSKLPKPEVHIYGADCLLCIAVATAMNSTLNRHADSLSSEDLSKLKERAASALTKKGVRATVIPEPIVLKELNDNSATELNSAKKDFAVFGKKYGIDKLVVLNVDAIGFERRYASYVPTSDPKGFVLGTGFMVNLKTNTYEWYEPLNVVVSADGKWDEPTAFPGLTNAYYRALEIGGDRLVSPFVDQ